VSCISFHGLRGSASPVLRATGLVSGQWRTLTLYRINTPQPIAKKFVIIDYVPETKRCAEFGENSSIGGFCANSNRCNITNIFLFILTDTARNSAVRRCRGISIFLNRCISSSYSRRSCSCCCYWPCSRCRSAYGDNIGLQAPIDRRRVNETRRQNEVLMIRSGRGDDGGGRCARRGTMRPGEKGRA